MSRFTQHQAWAGDAPAPGRCHLWGPVPLHVIQMVLRCVEDVVEETSKWADVARDEGAVLM